MRTFLRLSAVIGAAAVVVALTSATALAQTTNYPIDGSSPEVDTATPDPGDCVTVTQAGLAPGSNVTFVLTDADGTTTTISTTTDASGVATASVCVPADAANGVGNIVVVDGTLVLGQVVVSIGSQEGDADLAFTGRTIGATLTVATLAIAFGGVLLALSRRREGVIV